MRIGQCEFERIPSPVGVGGGPVAVRINLPYGGGFALGLDQLTVCHEEWEKLRHEWRDVGRVVWATVDPSDQLQLRCGQTIILGREQLRRLIHYVQTGQEHDAAHGCPRCGDSGEWRSLGLVCRRGHGLFG